MIKLENIPIDYLSVKYYSPIIQRIVEERNIKTIQELVDEMEKSPEINWAPIANKLFSTIKYVERSNKNGKEPVIFQAKQYADSSLEHTDTLNDGDILLLTKPTTEFNVSLKGLSYLTIDKIKRFLSTTTPNGSNFLMYRMRQIGTSAIPSSIPSILNTLDMYSDQVVRQSLLTDSREENLFTYQQKEKKEIVEEKYAEIIAYLIYDTKEFIWGELSDAQRRAYLSSIVNNRQIDRLIRVRMINNVSNYTTLPELKNVAKGDYKVLKRFIKR